ncbi:ribosome-associated protein [Oxalobacteraceae bacterium GrIS 2.11]
MQQLQFELTDDYISLNDLLKVTGLCQSGGAGKVMVAQGMVKVDGKQELRKTCKIRAGQTVELAGIRIKIRAKSGT